MIRLFLRISDLETRGFNPGNDGAGGNLFIDVTHTFFEVFGFDDLGVLNSADADWDDFFKRDLGVSVKAGSDVDADFKVDAMGAGLELGTEADSSAPQCASEAANETAVDNILWCACASSSSLAVIARREIIGSNVSSEKIGKLT